jgi:hypothetical protein
MTPGFNEKCGLQYEPEWQAQRSIGDMKMKRYILAAALLLGVTIGAVVLARSKSNTRESIIKMAEKGASETELLAAVEAGKREPLSADDVIKLKQAGVPNNVVVEMLNKSGTQSKP